MAAKENIHPVFERLLNRNEREKKLRQHAKVIWLMGLSGSGKSTIASALENELYLRDYKCMVLDGDNVRTGINNNLRFSEEDRMENIRRVSEVAKLFLDAGIITICSFITPMEKHRQLIRSIIPTDDLLLIYINTSVEECERRDVKGLYAKARRGEIKDFTGVNAPFEQPASPSLVVNTEGKTIYESFEEVLSFVLPKLRHDDRPKNQYDYYNI